MNSFREINRKRANLLWHLVDIFSGMISIIGTFYEHYIGREYEREIIQFNLQKKKSILHIGCGAYPITALIFGNYITGTIVSIDKNPFVVAIAKNIVKKKKHHNNILIKQGDGSDFDVSNFDVIIISSCSFPQEKVLNNVFSNAKSSSILIVLEMISEIPKLKKITNSYKYIRRNGEIDCRVFPRFHWRSFCFNVKK